jgi:hypothetical protein
VVRFTARAARAIGGALAALTLASVAGCVTPQAVVRLYPDSKDVVWRAGRGAMTQEKDGFRVAAAFDYQHDDRLGIRVEIENRSEARVDVDHGAVSYERCTTPKVCTGPYAVMDPEQTLVDMDLARAREQADKANDQTAGTAFALLSTVGAIGAVASGNHRAALDASVRTSAIESSAQDEAIAHDQRIMTIDAGHAEWATVALRRTTLLPGEGVAGDVFIAVDETATLIWLRVDVGRTTFWFPFRQAVQAPPAPSGGYQQHGTTG